MTTAKLAISLPTKVLARARRSARREGAPSLSAYISEAIEQKTSMDDLKHMLDELLESTGGPLSAAEQSAADRVLVRGKRKR